MKSLGQVYPESTELLGASMFLSQLSDEDEKKNIMEQYYEAVKDHMDELHDRDIGVLREVVGERRQSFAG